MKNYKIYNFDNLPKKIKIQYEDFIKNLVEDSLDFFNEEDAITYRLKEVIIEELKKLDLYDSISIDEIYWDASYSQGSGAGFEYTVTNIKKYLKAAGFTKKERKQLARDEGVPLSDLKDYVIKAQHTGGNYYHCKTYKIITDFYEPILFFDLNEKLQKVLQDSLYDIYEDEENHYKGWQKEIIEENNSSFLIIDDLGNFIFDSSTIEYEEYIEKYNQKIKELKNLRFKRKLEKQLTSKQENYKEKKGGKI